MDQRSLMIPHRRQTIQIPIMMMIRKLMSLMKLTKRIINNLSHFALCSFPLFPVNHKVCVSVISYRESVIRKTIIKKMTSEREGERERVIERERVRCQRHFTYEFIINYNSHWSYTLNDINFLSHSLTCLRYSFVLPVTFVIPSLNYVSFKIHKNVQHGIVIIGIISAC